MQSASQLSQAEPADAHLTDSSGILVDDYVQFLGNRPLKHACPTPDLRPHNKKQCIQQVGSLVSSHEQTASHWEIQEVNEFEYGTCMLSAVGNASPDERPALVKDVCYGMLIFDFPTTSQTQFSSRGDSNPTPMTITNDVSAVATASNEDEITYLDTRTRKILKALKAEAAVHVQALAVPTNVIHAQKSKQQREVMTKGHALWINIYGPPELFETIGTFASHCKMFLQDPKYCDRNVEYCNPHRMPFDEVCYTQSLPKPDPALPPSEIVIRQPRDLFCDFELDENLAETSPPADVLKTTLQSHQKKALTFMLRRERGWCFDGNGQEMWSRSTNEAGQRIYLNLVTGETSELPPPDFRGGKHLIHPAVGEIMALHLNVHHIPPEPHWSLFLYLLSKSGRANCNGEYIKWHLIGSVANNQQSCPCSCDEVDFVSTYHTVLAEWKRSTSERSDAGQSMHAFPWHRIILDEAHVIRQASTMLARAIFALNACCRWAVTDAVMNSNQCKGSLNALQLITRLRLICNHGVNEMTQESANIKTSLSWGAQLAQDTFESLRDTGQAYCLNCRQDLSFVMTDTFDCGDTTTLQPQVSKDLQVLVVFSYWTQTLDLIETQLKALSIPYNRLDGRLSATKRNRVLEDFRSRSAAAVLLISITCGAVGLDLTAASRAYIMEPQWNPMAEEQALDRIHRIGQTKPNVARLQEKKRDLAELILSKEAVKPGNASQSRLMVGSLLKFIHSVLANRREQLQYLRSLIE
ncbi:hypothetical protein G7Y79_00033g067900 [Physcia stellaris]|nr:hypothetical protein G7Y79_00033g067900 [Physcia stellaris]